MLLIDIDPDYCQKGPGRVERWRFDPEKERGYTHQFSIPRDTLEYSAIVVKAINERQEEILKIIRSGLKNYEFEFETDEEFRDFCRQRVIRAQHWDSFVYSYYIDGLNQLICTIDETINVPALKNTWENG